ncbi:hypothetical protein QWZ13_08100 [Reinekea marina]|nr:hypothetical protein [Reinekea marina]MDN3648871.1 hypothetical protein [Reinekea marina]
MDRTVFSDCRLSDSRGEGVKFLRLFYHIVSLRLTLYLPSLNRR